MPFGCGHFLPLSFIMNLRCYHWFNTCIFSALPFCACAYIPSCFCLNISLFSVVCPVLKLLCLLAYFCLSVSRSAFQLHFDKVLRILLIVLFHFMFLFQVEVIYNMQLVRNWIVSQWRRSWAGTCLSTLEIWKAWPALDANWDSSNKRRRNWRC